jgi:hypothetical protein
VPRPLEPQQVGAQRSTHGNAVPVQLAALGTAAQRAALPLAPAAECFCNMVRHASARCRHASPVIRAPGDAAMTVKSPSDAVVLKPETLPVHERGGGARTTPLVSPSLSTHSFITGYTSFDGSTEIPFHSHN